MSLPTGLRPRSAREREKLAGLLRRAPHRVAVPAIDDGWLSVNLRISGRVPVVAPEHRERIDTVLARFGLPTCDVGASDACLTPTLELVGASPHEQRPLPPADGPLVSILICTFNRRHVIEQAIASARAQSWPCEIVVVNDGSSDGTRELLDAQEGLVVRHKENGGKPTALNLALEVARGEAVLVLDDDDELLPGAVQVLAHALFGNPSLGMVFGDTVSFDGDTGDVRTWIPASRMPVGRSFESILTTIPGMPGACLIRRRTQDAAGRYDRELVRGQDMDMYLRLARVAPFASLPFATFLYRVHDGPRGSATGQWNREQHDERFRSFVQPTFLARLEAYGPGQGDLRYTWAMGLHRRGLTSEARKLIRREKGPYSPRQAWIRREVGLKGRSRPTGRALVVVHDGEPGALEETLARHAQLDRDLWVMLEVPCDPLGPVRFFWEGTYGAGGDLRTWLGHADEVHLRLTSSPDWTPPPLAGAHALLNGRASSAVHAICAALGWPEPDRRRSFQSPALEGTAARLVEARQRLREGRPAEALGLLEPVLAANAEWPLAWRFAAEIFESLEMKAEASRCRARGQLVPS